MRGDPANPNDWMAFACRDLKWASNDFAEGEHLRESAVLQQASEKALKSWLIEHGWELVKTHDVTGLAQAAIQRGANLHWFLATAERFTPGTPPGGDLLKMAAPAEDWMSRQFEVGILGPVREVDEFHLPELRAIEKRFRVLDAKAEWKGIDGLAVLDTRQAIPGDQRPDFGVEVWYRRS